VSAAGLRLGTRTAPRMSAARTPRTLVGLALVLVTVACTRTDIVAVAPPPSPPLMGDAAPCVAPACCDAASCMDARVEPACDGGECARDAGCDADSCNVPPPPVCEPLTCSAFDDRAAYCATPPAEPLVQFGDGCEPGQAPSFRFAVCSCQGGLVTDTPFELDVLSGAAEASLAVNGDLRLGADAKIAGSIYVSGSYSVLAASPPQVTGQIHEGVAPACDCAESRLLDVAGLVAERALDNDNAQAGLEAGALDGFSGARSLTLDCGRYYLTRIAGDGSIALEARGRIAIFIGGNIELNGGLTLTLSEQASAEIYVAGNVRVDARLELGTGNEGNRVLLAVGGDGNIQLNGDAIVEGSLYAPRAALVTRSETLLELHGALFVRYANLNGTSRVHYQPLGPVSPTCQAAP
jgi:hypothetical protein